ncbi:MAG: hypothetical protein H6834_09130 [Planctomycetes bacterium]|nr:hypothetical protein [Planctomycetota bacterium]
MNETKRSTVTLFLLSWFLLLAACSENPNARDRARQRHWTWSTKIGGKELLVSMPGIVDGGKLPNRYVGGFMAYSDNSPAFTFEKFPDGTKSWAFAVHVSKNDGPFDPYFAVADLPPAKEFEEIGEGFFNIGIPNLMDPTIGADGWTLWQVARRHRIYHGPQPSEDDLGSEYVVEFRFYALDRELGLRDGFKPADFDEAADGHVLDRKTFTATYVVE